VHDDFSWSIEVGPPPTPTPLPNNPPIGSFDEATCTDVQGWARDPDTDPLPSGNNGPVLVNIWDGPPPTTFLGQVVANQPREAAVGNHAFVWSVPNSLKDGLIHQIYTYAHDNQNVAISTHLIGSPRAIQCVLNQPPVTTSVSVTEPSYCTSAPSALVEWSYSDPEGNPQSAYQVQIDDDPAFGSPIIDTGGIACELCRSYFSPSTLAFNTTYHARVMTWDSNNLPSPWQTMTVCTGPGCQPGNTSWRTPQHAYPNNIDFSWTPSSPAANQIVQFTNTAICYALGNTPAACASWAWNFGDGGSSTSQNPSHSYGSEGSFPVTFSVTDAQGYTCPSGTPLTKTINIQKKIPTWKEVAPR